MNVAHKYQVESREYSHSFIIETFWLPREGYWVKNTVTLVKLKDAIKKLFDLHCIIFFKNLRGFIKHLFAKILCHSISSQVMISTSFQKCQKALWAVGYLTTDQKILQCFVLERWGGKCQNGNIFYSFGCPPTPNCN